MGKEQLVLQKETMLEEDSFVVKKFREKAKKLSFLHQSQNTKMNSLSKAFNQHCKFFVFYEDEPNDPEVIEGTRMGAFIQEHFSKQKKNSYITDIFFTFGVSVEFTVFVYNKERNEWLN